MAMNSKQRLLGGIVLLGGGVLFAAILLQNNKHDTAKDSTVSQTTNSKVTEPVQPAEINLQPLSVDVETEKKLLEQQRIAREQAVAEQEQRAAEYLATQQQAEAEAAKKAAAEQAAIMARRQSQMQSSDNIPPELVAESKPQTPNASVDKAKREADLKAQQAKADAAAKAKREADLKAQQAKAEAAAKAKREADLKAQQSKADAAAKAKRDAELKAQKAKSDAAAKAKAEDAARAREILENGDKKWMVQVALASSQYSADSMTAKLRAKGYQVTQSPTSKGVRIMVGPAKSRDSAETMRKKITSDSSLNMKSAWVIGWVPLDQR